MTQTIIMIKPKFDDDEPTNGYGLTMEIDDTSRETQATTIGEAMLRAVELSKTYPDYERHKDNIFFRVMFANIKNN